MRPWIALDIECSGEIPEFALQPWRLRQGRAWITTAAYARRNKAGDRLSFEFASTAGNRSRELTEQVMQSQWKTIGVDVTIHNQPSRNFFGELLRKRQFNGFVEFSSTSEPGLPPIRWTTANTPTEANNWGGQNYSTVSNPQFDADVEAAQYELDPVKQQALWADMQRLYATELLGLPLYFRTDPDIIPAWLDGFVATGKENYVTYWAADWRVK